jgi:SIR2-like domain
MHPIRRSWRISHTQAPDISELIHQMGERLGYDGEVFATLGNPYVLAEYYNLVRGGLGDLRSWMDVSWHRSDIDISKSEVHRLIADLRFPIIYTTNYDRWIENALEAHGKPYAKVAEVSDLLEASRDKTQVIKFHGDFSKDESLVLTESSYFERLDFASYLDVKLRADSLANSILFIGYSLADVNIRFLLYKLHRIWTDSGKTRLRPKSFIFLQRGSEIEQVVLRNWGIHTLFSKNDDPGTGLTDFLGRLVSAVAS